MQTRHAEDVEHQRGLLPLISGGNMHFLLSVKRHMFPPTSGGERQWSFQVEVQRGKSGSGAVFQGIDGPRIQGGSEEGPGGCMI